jgi:hypothetical protein
LPGVLYEAMSKSSRSTHMGRADVCVEEESHVSSFSSDRSVFRA